VTISTSFPSLILSRAGTTFQQDIKFQDLGSNRWSIGQAVNAVGNTLDFYSYSFGQVLGLNYSTGAATFSSSVSTKALSSTTSGAGNLTAYIGNNVTSASGSTGYGLAIESEASAATSYAFTCRNLSGSNTYFLISTETGKVGNVLIGTATNGSSKLRIVGLPTSSAGLSSGDVWSDSGTLKIV
jgi:hypothetical protein